MSRDRFAVIGDPIAHSLSPRMHAAAFSAAGLDAIYEPMRVPTVDLYRTVRSMRERGYRGFNVTLPHKRAIMPLLDRVDPLAFDAGAVNTVVREGKEFAGYNTDIEGFNAALEQLVGREWHGTSLVFGAGGAARAVVLSLATRGGPVVISNRTVGAADALVANFGGTVSVVRDRRELAAAVQATDLLVNATSLGLGQLAHLSPLPAEARFKAGAVAIDLVYGRVTPFLEAACGGGCRVQGGIEMLVQQGAAAFRLWTGAEPDIEAMRVACENRLAEAAS